MEKDLLTLMAITNGLLAAVDDRLRDGSDGDTKRPTCIRVFHTMKALQT